MDMLNKAKTNKSNRAIKKVSGVNVMVRYRPNDKGLFVFRSYNVASSYFVYVNGEVVAGLYEIEGRDSFILALDLDKDYNVKSVSEIVNIIKNNGGFLIW